MSSARARMVGEDIKEKFTTLLSQNPSLTPDEAMKRTEAMMLANNPFQPPTGRRCPINDLPNELLGHIFFLGAYEDDEEEDEEEDEDEHSDDDDAFDLARRWETSSEGPSDDASSAPDDAKDKDDIEMGSCSDSSGSSSSFSSDDDDDRQLPFQVVASHVCSKWRSVALSTPSLWKTINICPYDSPFDRCRAYIERSGGLPLNLDIDLTLEEYQVDIEGDEDRGVEVDVDGDDEGEGEITTITITRSGSVVARDDGSDNGTGDPADSACSDKDIDLILDIICPHSKRWRSIAVAATHYKSLHRVLVRFDTLPPAPLLEELQLQHLAEEDLDPEAVFNPPSLKLPYFVPFQGKAPNLRSLSLWGIHFGWDEACLEENNTATTINSQKSPRTTLFDSMEQLTELELAYHVSDVRPSFVAFASILRRSPLLTKLALSASGPAGSPSDWFIPGTKVLQKIALPKLSELDLRFHEPDYAVGLVQALDMPSLRHLTIDFDSADYTDFVKVLAGQSISDRTAQLTGGRKQRSILSGLEFLKICSLPCDKRRRDLLLGELQNVKHLFLKCASEDVADIFARLQNPNPSATSSEGSENPVMFCPLLKTLSTTDITGKEMIEVVRARAEAGVPLAKVCMCEEDIVTPKDSKWLYAHLPEGLDMFVDSDEEEEVMTDEEWEDEGADFL
ncbi:hypothetical protein PC9H_010784 [Pleurotus ostreatus]|uniref:F-box domain-containing protein n=2 Tax=Pleurotus TaxID=5320 RepID=A0A8H6ZPE4_PLEOS|nr:uncharacterized protein PC9H_010784 [Pleurotus ostreatus]KAF7422628.1 hypothetical protein PC9H_010784 [Pleurotus ostreatus]KAG9227516.1 hypothetical protein CCMSSC00406_0000838 [Pleurotus cornucopiae]KAJ8691494.1 hypothetical protein PTI98_011060 [Pleurotus ostreatus]